MNWGKFVAVAVGTVIGVTFASAAQAQTVKVCDGMDFTSCPNAVVAGQNAFVRFEFGKPVAEVFKDVLGTKNVPTSGKFSFVVARSAESAPLVQYGGTLLVSRYTNMQSVDFTLQADEETLRDTEGTLADPGIRDRWLREAKRLPNGRQTWQVYLFFAPGDTDGASTMVAQGTFDYNARTGELTPTRRVTVAAQGD